MGRLLLVAAALVFQAAPASAEDTFDTRARGAVELPNLEGLGALFWSQLARCKADDDFSRRQCEGVREARRARVAAATFLVTADGALDPQPFNDKAMSVDVTVRACAACRGVELAGERRYLVGRGEVKLVGGRVRPVALHTGTMTFKTRAEGRDWVARVLPRLRAELLVRVPAALESWSQGGASGYKLEVVGWRVVDPCKGQVLWSQPPAASVPAEPDTCTPAPARRRTTVRPR